MSYSWLLSWMDWNVLLQTRLLDRTLMRKVIDYSMVYRPPSSSSSFRERTGLEMQRIWLVIIMFVDVHASSFLFSGFTLWCNILIPFCCMTVLLKMIDLEFVLLKNV